MGMEMLAQIFAVVIFIAMFAFMLHFNCESIIDLVVKTKRFGQINLFTPLFLISSTVPEQTISPP